MTARLLGIETSCDETAAAVVDGDGRVLAHAMHSQTGEHLPFGGIVPEVAARSHLRHLDGLIGRVMAESGTTFGALSAVAATAGPGLIGGVLVGVMTAKAISAAADVPFIAVNHLEGHALTARFTDQVEFPYLLLLVSGGHCQLLAVEGVGRYRRYGTTLDDAAGEAFDKVAKLLGLGYPGGPAIERAARTGTDRHRFPPPMKGKPGCDFSFSGLKTAVRTAVEALPADALTGVVIANIAASFQSALVAAVADRTARACAAFARDFPSGRALVVAGGVGANGALRRALTDVAAGAGLSFVAPPPALCTDNAVMIAWAGLERFRLGLTDPLDFKARPRWPLDPSAPPAIGAGVKA
jgi:N6-L-threonylcarbamoyladenine synthase